MHRRLRLLVAAALTSVAATACHRDVQVPPSRAAAADRVAPRQAGGVFVPMEGEVAVLLPAGLTYCPMPPGAEGIWRGQTFYLAAPAACRADGDALGPDHRPAPSIYIRAENNLNAFEARGGIGEARTAAELMRQVCARPAELPGVRLFDQPAIGCRVERSGTIEITAAALYYENASESPGVAPDHVLTVTLHTTQDRVDADLRVLASVAGGAYRCAEVRGRAGLPPCPPSGPW